MNKEAREPGDEHYFLRAKEARDRNSGRELIERWSHAEVLSGNGCNGKVARPL